MSNSAPPTTLAGYGIADAFTKTEVEDALAAESAARSAADLTLQANIGTLSADITAQLGAANGIATLGSDGKVPAAQLPSYVDDVLEFAAQANFPATGETGKIYVAKDTNKTYRWSGSVYVYITSGTVDAAPLASPALTGAPTAPTAAVNTNTTQLATTAFVIAQIAAAAAGSAGTAIDGGSF